MLGAVEIHVIREGVVSSPGALWPPDVPAGRRAVWSRDVILSVDGTGVIAARSITAAIDARAAWKPVKTLGARPLATILYQDPAVSRSPFSYAPFDGRSFANDPNGFPNTTLSHWGRSSLFYRKRAPLLVAEIFLPALWSIIVK
jgi:chorismate--pyruvate lyase